MTQEELVNSAVPATYFAFPPYRAELFNEKSGWSGVMNRNGFNVLTFPPTGQTITDFDTAEKIAQKWNDGQK